MNTHSWRPGAHGTQVCNNCSSVWWPNKSEPGGGVCTGGQVRAS